MRKKDYILAIIAGVVTALFILPVLKNVNLYLSYWIALFFIIPALWVLLIFFSSLLKERYLWLRQFAKFLIIGFLNTGIDFGILNLMSAKFGIYAGLKIIGINPFSLIFASSNSFLWNKYWTFETKGKPRLNEIIQFVLVMIIGMVINTAIVILLTSYISPSSFLTKGRILNLAKAIATAISLFWNFTGMKIFVFRKITNERSE